MSVRAAASRQLGPAEPPKRVGFLGIHPNARARHRGDSNGVGTGRSPLDGCDALVHPAAARAQGATGRDPMVQKDFRKRGWDKMPAQDTADYAVARACADGLELLTKK